MVVSLFMHDNYYLSHAMLEYTVPADRFMSTAMDSNIRPFIDFLKVITGADVSEDDTRELLRAFTELFNDAENKPRTIQINDVSLRLEIDKFYNVISLVVLEK